MAQASTGLLGRTSFAWQWQGRPVTLGLTRDGSGPTALLLPALSSISTRSEMAPLAARLGTRFSTVAVDWPGFGAAPKPSAPWTPAELRAYLGFLLDEVVPEPALIVAAGHAAGYVLAHAAARPMPGRRLVLVAPTWRGPLPTMLGRRPPWLGRLARAADLPVLGAALYRLNVNPPMVRAMARAHVFSDPAWLTPARAAEKRTVTSAPGARHAAVRFVTGELDPFTDRAAFLAAAAALREPALLVYGADAPPKSRAEMEALATLPRMTVAVLPRGKLSLHEEFPDAVAEAALEFCSDRRAGRPPA